MSSRWFVALIPLFVAGTPSFSPPVVAEQIRGTRTVALPAANTAHRGFAQKRALTPDPRALALLDSALEKMGGANALKTIQRARFDQIVQWLGLRWDGEPHADAPSYNWNNNLRDYAINASRNVRRQSTGFQSAGVWPEFIDVVQDSVAMRRGANGQWGTLHRAYVEEQREIFGTAPERLLLAARESPDVRLGSDTLINGRPYARVLAALSNLSTNPTTIFIRRADGLPAMIRFRAAQPYDGGLAPLGPMEVEMWWSRWTATPLNGTKGVLYPMQWDVNRVKVPYQRITILVANFNVTSTPDSFVVNDSIRTAFNTGAPSRPMWQNTPIDSATVIDGHFAAGSRNGLQPIGVLVGKQWLLLEGNSPLDARKLHVDWLTRQVPSSRVSAMLVTAPNGLGVGTGWLTDQGIAVYVAPSAVAGVTAVGKSWGDVKHGTAVTTGRWVQLATDSVWIEPVKVSSGLQGLMLYVPSLRWMYSSTATAAATADELLAIARKRHWDVEFIGSPRNIKAAIPGKPAS